MLFKHPQLIIIIIIIIVALSTMKYNYLTSPLPFLVNPPADLLTLLKSVTQ